MIDGWHKITPKKPEQYQLVELTDGKKICRGWRSGYIWDGLKVPKNYSPTWYRLLNSYLDPAKKGEFDE